MEIGLFILLLFLLFVIKILIDIDANLMNYIDSNLRLNHINISGTYDIGTYDIGKLTHYKYINSVYYNRIYGIGGMFVRTQDLDITEQ